jgi:hypothetical protein
MPTATSLSARRLLNLGPLTTTFTAPASCSTGYRTLIAPATDPALFEWDVCPWLLPADCYPYGSVVQSLVASADGPDPAAGLFVAYNSPGLVCPAGWATVGAAAKPNPTSISISGAFNQSDAIPTDSDIAFFEPQLDVFLAALDPGETAILCCPRFAPFPLINWLKLISLNGAGADIILQSLHSRRWQLLLYAPKLGLHSDRRLRAYDPRGRPGHCKRHMDPWWTNDHGGSDDHHGNDTILITDDVICAL